MAWQPQASVPTGFADEESLLAGLRAGRREAFESLHGDFAAPIYNLALRIVDDPQDAQDVTQEVLIKVFRSPPQSSDPGFSLAAWLYRVTVNASFDHLRARKRRPVVAVDAGYEPAAVADEYERAELAGRVDATLRSLPKRQQVALVLRDVHGLSVGETASVLGVTRGSADVLLSRARKGFRRIFLAAGDESVAAPATCTVAEEALAGSVGGGLSAERRARLLEHARTCPDCRRTVDLWGVAPVGLGLLVSQVALPAKLSLAATFAAASAAGVAIPAAGLGAVGAVSAAGGSAGAVAGGAAAGAACGPAGAAGAGLLAKIGAAVGLKAVAVAAAATVAVGAAGVAGYEVDRTSDGPPGGSARPVASEVTQAGARGGAGRGDAPGALSRERRRQASRPGEGMGDGERSRSGFVGRDGAGGSAGSSHAGEGGAKSGAGAGGSPGQSGATQAGAAGGGSGSATGDGSGSGTGSTPAGGSGSGAGIGSGTGTRSGGTGTGDSGSGDAGSGAGTSGGGSGTVDDPSIGGRSGD
jgi:RNA polymerase sigma factor (sigma-70 family)